MPIFSEGNRCGHNKFAPILNPPDFQIPPKLPAILRDSIAKVEGFYHSPDILSAVWKGRPTPIQPHHKNPKFISIRVMRSERREAICRILVLLIAMTDLRTLNIGYLNYKTGQFRIPDILWFAEKSQLSELRVQRAMADLRRAGLLEVHERAVATKGEDGRTQFRARTALRKLSERVFTLLGIDRRRLHREKFTAKQRHLDRLQQLNPPNWLSTTYQTLFGRKRHHKILESRDGRQLWRPKNKEDFRSINLLAITLQDPSSELREQFEKAHYKALQIKMGIK